MYKAIRIDGPNSPFTIPLLSERGTAGSSAGDIAIIIPPRLAGVGFFPTVMLCKIAEFFEFDDLLKLRLTNKEIRNTIKKQILALLPTARHVLINLGTEKTTIDLLQKCQNRIEPLPFFKTSIDNVATRCRQARLRENILTYLTPITALAGLASILIGSSIYTSDKGIVPSVAHAGIGLLIAGPLLCAAALCLLYQHHRDRKILNHTPPTNPKLFASADFNPAP